MINESVSHGAKCLRQIVENTSHLMLAALKESATVGTLGNAAVSAIVLAELAELINAEDDSAWVAVAAELNSKSDYIAFDVYNLHEIYVSEESSLDLEVANMLCDSLLDIECLVASTLGVAPDELVQNTRNLLEKQYSPEYSSTLIQALLANDSAH